MSDPTHGKSHCCGAPVCVAGEGTTRYYECRRCERPCATSTGVVPPKPVAAVPEDTERKED